jgi:hypothetical protein
MDDLTPHQQELYDLLLASIAPLAESSVQKGAVGGIEATSQPEAAVSVATVSPFCAAIIREQRLQYRFMVLYQSLVAFMAVLCVALIAIAAVLLTQSLPFAGVVSGAGSIASGVFGGWLERQRKDARDANKAALKALATSGCSELPPQP